MNKVEVKVCIGTACFVKGKNNLQELNDIVSKKYEGKVEIVTSNCLGLCSINWEHSKAPYVKVGDEVISEATVDKIIDAIDKKLG